MGMSTHIKAFIPETDSTYQKQLAVFKACQNAGVSLPKETAQYFGCEEPYEGLEEEKLEFKLEKGVHYIKFCKNADEGFEIDLKKLPKEVSKIRFFNSY